MITIVDFESLKPDTIFATGLLPNAWGSLLMDDSGGMLKWVAVKGGGNDWAVYCDKPDKDDEDIKRTGTKVTLMSNVKKCVSCTAEVYKLYRY